MKKINTTDIARLFGKMVKIANGVVESYTGDLYHDAKVLSDMEGKESVSAIWAVGDCGTHLAMDVATREDCAWFGLEFYDKYDHYRITYCSDVLDFKIERIR